MVDSASERVFPRKLALWQFRQLGNDGSLDYRQEIGIGVQRAAAADEKGELGARFAIRNPHSVAPCGVFGELRRHRTASVGRHGVSLPAGNISRLVEGERA